MNDLRSSKQDERMEEMLEMLESMEKELTQKDSIIRQKDSEIQILQAVYVGIRVYVKGCKRARGYY